MKIKLQLVLIFFSILMIIGCDKSVTDPETKEEVKIDNYKSELEKLFPANIGSSFTYSIDTMNTNTKSYEKIGTRVLTVDNIVLENGFDNFVCKEKYDFLGADKQSKFRISENSIDFFYDSSGVSKLIPDSMDVALFLDEAFKVIQYPFASKTEWDVFKTSVNFGTFKFKIVTITGQYVGEENLQLAGFDNGIMAKKFKYLVTINIPDISNPFVSKIQNYTAYAWLAEQIGLVKIEGCKMFINPISGKGFNIADSNKVIRHTLTSFN